MKLYEINEAILSCVDAETGEILNEEMLNALVMVREQKIENVACWIKDLTVQAEALGKEKKELERREKQTLKMIEGLKNWLNYALDGQKFKSTRCTVSFRNNEKVQQVEGAEIPEGFRRIKTVVEPNKDDIKTALKAGKEVKGFFLQPTRSVIVK